MQNKLTFVRFRLRLLRQFTLSLWNGRWLVDFFRWHRTVRKAGVVDSFLSRADVQSDGRHVDGHRNPVVNERAGNVVNRWQLSFVPVQSEVYEAALSMVELFAGTKRDRNAPNGQTGPN